MFRSEQQAQGQPNLSRIPTQSWYPPSVLTPTSVSSRVSSSSSNSAQSGASPLSKPGPSLLSPSASPTSSFTATYPPLRDKSVEELRELLTDKAAYVEFLHSLDQVKTLDNLQEDLKKNNIELAKQNLDEASKIAELRNQCAIIRTTELAAAKENFDRVQMEARNLYNQLRAPVLIKKLQEAADQVDEESERLHQQLLEGEVEMSEFISKYRKLRVLYHRRTLVGRAASVTMGRAS